MPKYSIVIPTRSRAHLLENALRCALSQTFGDYEVIVSDNQSVDNTASIVEKVKTPRLHYYRTPQDYPMHDSWEFALSKASGEWITYLADDSGISSQLLAEVEATLAVYPVEAVSWSHLGLYYHYTWQGIEQTNMLVYHPFSGTRQMIDAKIQLSNLFKHQANHMHPMGLNSFCHRSVIEKIKKKTGRFFFPSCPDYTSCALLLSSIDRYVYVDLPLGINGIGAESIGMAHLTKRGKSAENFAKEFKEPLLHNVPLTTTVITNYVTESLLLVKDALPEAFKTVDIDWSAYFLSCYIQLGYLKQNGVDVQFETEELFCVLKKEPWSVQLKFFKDLFFYKTKLQRIPGNLRNRLRGLIRRFSWFRSLEKTVRTPSTYGGTVLGSDASFSNLFEAVRYLDTHVLS